MTTYAMQNALKTLPLAMVTMATLLISGIAFAQQQDSQKKSSSLPEGYGELQWGVSLSDAKQKVLGKITFTDDKRVILSRDGNIEYTYGFHLPDPSLVQPSGTEKKDRDADAKKKVNEPGAAQQQGGESRLYYVLVRFPYLAMDDVRNKIQEKYGPPGGEAIEKNQGAYLWYSPKTSIVMWVDQYEKKPFCRKITYVGKEISREVNEYQKQIFNKNEIEILRTLNP